MIIQKINIKEKMMNAAENKGVDTTVATDSDTNTNSTTPTTDNNNTPSSNNTNNRLVYSEIIRRFPS